MLDETELSALLRRKRDVQPPAEYFESFVREFHRRQREEMLRQPVWRIALDRVSAFLTEQTPPTPRYAIAGFAAFVIGAIAAIQLLFPAPQEPARLAHNQPGPVPPIPARTLLLDQPTPSFVLTEQPLLAQPRPDRSGATRYVIDARPAVYEPASSY